MNYDAEHSESVKNLIINNAVYWIREYNLDGLRLDAVHAIIDESPRHLFHELAADAPESSQPVAATTACNIDVGPNRPMAATNTGGLWPFVLLMAKTLRYRWRCSDDQAWAVSDS